MSMSEGSTPSESKMGQNEIWEGFAKVFDGARNEAVKLPGGHELKHGEVWGALAGAAVIGAGVLLGSDPTRQVVENINRYGKNEWGKMVEGVPTFLQFAQDILHDHTEAFRAGSNNNSPIMYGGTLGGERENKALHDFLGLNTTDMNELRTELSKMEIHRQFRNIASLAIAGAGFVSGVLAVTTEKAKERVVWSDTIGPLLAKGIRAMNNVSEHP